MKTYIKLDYTEKYEHFYFIQENKDCYAWDIHAFNFSRHTFDDLCQELARLTKTMIMEVNEPTGNEDGRHNINIYLFNKENKQFCDLPQKRLWEATYQGLGCRTLAMGHRDLDIGAWNGSRNCALWPIYSKRILPVYKKNGQEWWSLRGIDSDIVDTVTNL